MIRDGPGQVPCKDIIFFRASFLKEPCSFMSFSGCNRFCSVRFSSTGSVQCRVAGSGTKERDPTDDLPVSNPYPLAFHNLRV
jgi:hypothetical protein